MHQLWARYRSHEHDEFAPPLQIVSFGLEQWHPGRVHRRGHSELYGVEYVLEGDVAFTQEGKEYLVGKGEVYLLRRGVAHVYRTGPSGTLRKYYIALEGPLLESLLLATGLDDCDHVVPDSPHEVERLFKQIHSAMAEKRSNYAFELSSLAYRLLIDLSRSVSRRYPEPIRAAVEFIDQNLTKQLTTDEIRGVTGLSPTHFNRLFRQHVGLSPKQFFIKHKLAWARHLLEESPFSIKEISATLGYEDPLYFSSQFRKHTGLSPRFHRRRANQIAHRK